jgi:DNA segregation ATPase FtsK/SpoIIIE, S-DNA-T family
MAVHPKHKTREMSGVLFVGLSLALFLALFSHQPFDPSLNVATGQSGSRNLIGPIGAWTSDLLLQVLGLTAFLVPIPLIIIGTKKLLGRPMDFVLIKTVGYLGLLISSAGLLMLWSDYLGDWIDFAPGGALGALVARLAAAYLNWTGASIVLALILVLALTLTTRFSLERTLLRIGAVRRRLSPDLAGRFDNWKERREDRRRLAELRKVGGEVVNQPIPRRIAFDTAGGPASQPERTAPSSASRNPAPEPVLNKPEPRNQPATSRAWVEKEVVSPEVGFVYRLPSLDLLKDPPGEIDFDEAELRERAMHLQAKCSEFGVLGRVLQIHPGPVVTTFEFKPDPGVKYSRITNLADDLCLAMKAESVRIDRVPGKNTVGIEVPNKKRHVIYLKEILASNEFLRAESNLTLALGQTINGSTFVADLARMPHLLIAGSTGSGKSVGLNCMVCSILYKAGPDEVRFIMVDPKRLELGLYEDIPHLLTPIVTDPKKAANALNWAVREMEDRYRLLAQRGVRNITQYNNVIREALHSGEEEEAGPLPAILILVDELADLMMTAGKEVETAVTRLAQMARAVGIHLILATQRPSVDVITGLIKANFPSRISFRVSSKIDSRTILDGNGAEQLLGMGDMLFLSPETSRLVRIHGAFISEKEIGRIVQFLRQQGEPDYQEEVLIGEEDSDTALVDPGEVEDDLYEEAARFVVEARKASTSLLQRRFRIGYGRAARLLDIMEHEGVVGPSEGSRPREILVPATYFDEIEN